MICVSMISICISVSGFEELTVAVKLVPLKPNDRKYFSAETANACIFSKVTPNKNSFQSSVAPQNLHTAVNLKPYTTLLLASENTVFYMRTTLQSSMNNYILLWMLLGYFSDMLVDKYEHICLWIKLSQCSI